MKAHDEPAFPCEQHFDNLPYVVCSLPGNVNAHFDTRECDLMRVSDAYAAPFEFVMKKG